MMPTLQIVPNTNMRVVTSVWFGDNRTGQPIGVVLVEDMNMHYVKAYIGSGEGADQRADEEYIAQWGSKVMKNMAEGLFGPLPDWRD